MNQVNCSRNSHVAPSPSSGRDADQLNLNFHHLALNVYPEEHKAMETTLTSQPHDEISCLFHINILKETIRRNRGLIQTYQSCSEELHQDERFNPTRNLYQRLIEELREANRKMSRIEKELGNSPPC
jgi:hypothetical protein